MNKNMVFNILKSKWLKETKYTSNYTDIVMNINYQRIIGMGKDALPLIFSKQEKINVEKWLELTTDTIFLNTKSLVCALRTDNINLVREVAILIKDHMEELISLCDEHKRRFEGDKK